MHPGLPPGVGAGDDGAVIHALDAGAEADLSGACVFLNSTLISHGLRVFGFDARPSRWSDGGVLMLYNADGFSLALGPTHEPIRLPKFLHFGIHLASRDVVRSLRDRLATDAVAIVEVWDEPD